MFEYCSIHLDALAMDSQAFILKKKSESLDWNGNTRFVLLLSSAA